MSGVATAVGWAWLLVPLPATAPAELGSLCGLGPGLLHITHPGAEAERHHLPLAEAKNYSETHSVSQGLGSELMHPFCPCSIGQGEPHAQDQSQQAEKYTFAYTTMGQRRWIKAGVLKN